MKKLFTVCILAGAMTFNANAQNFGSLLKSLTSGSKTETTTETTTTDNTNKDNASTSATADILGNLLGTLANSGSTSANEEGTALTSDGIVSGLLGAVLNAFTTVNQETILGTWSFKGSAFVFESEKALANLGSDAIASQVEAKVDSYLAKLNIKAGTSTITFNEDNTCTFVAGKRTLNGTYEFNVETKELKLNYAGLLSTTAYLVYDAGTINIVYQSDGLLRILKAIGSMSSNSSLALLNTLLNQYNGLRIGMAFTK